MKMLFTNSTKTGAAIFVVINKICICNRLAFTWIKAIWQIELFEWESIIHRCKIMFCVIFIVVHCSLMTSQSVLVARNLELGIDECNLNEDYSIRQLFNIEIPVIVHCVGERRLFGFGIPTRDTQRQNDITMADDDDDDEFGVSVECSK